MATWSGDATGTEPSVTVSMNEDRGVTASFAEAATLTVHGAGTGSGSVTATGIDCVIDAGVCSGDCSEKVVRGTPIELTATPAANSLFSGWSGDAAGADLGITVDLDVDKDVTATFTLRPYTPGDVTGDSTIDLLDVVLCQQIARGWVVGTAQQREAADVDGDGDVDENDVTILSEYVLGLRTTLP